MIDREIIDEVARQLEIWGAAYANVNKYNEEIALLHMQIAEIDDKIESEEAIKESSKAVIDALIADVDDTDENREQIESVMVERLGRVIVDGFVR